MSRQGKINIHKKQQKVQSEIEIHYCCAIPVALEVYFQLVSCLEEVVEAASRVGPRAPLPLVVLPPYGDLVVRREVLKLPRVQVVSAKKCVKWKNNCVATEGKSHNNISHITHFTSKSSIHNYFNVPGTDHDTETGVGPGHRDTG